MVFTNSILLLSITAKFEKNNRGIQIHLMYLLDKPIPQDLKNINVMFSRLFCAHVYY